MSSYASTIDPEVESDRMEAVRRYDILDSPPDGAFDRIAALAARIYETPIATITIVDHDRIWFKAAHGIEVDQIGRDPGLCASAIIQPTPYVVTDASVDPRTLENPLVRGELGLRFYAAVPLRTSDGHNLGTLNIIDSAPREMDTSDLANLEDLAAIVVDELELRLAARATVALQAANEAARFRDAIIAGVTHEMRTPLAVLKGLASLEADPAGSTDEEVQDIRAMRRRQLNHLDWLVRQFLDYTSLEGDRPPQVEPRPLDVGALAHDVAEVFDSEGLLTIQVDDGVPDAYADPDRTQQILFELTNNAIRFGQQQPVDVHVTATLDTVRIAVTDRGHGIHADDLDQVYDKRFRGRTSTGTGLGLYVAKIFAEAQGGRIEVTSEIGVGSTFTLVLPVAT